MDSKYVLLLLCAFALAGCLSPPADVGCCVNANATSSTPGCWVYYQNNDSLLDLMANTFSCNATGLYCNVSFTHAKGDANYDANSVIVPFCPNDNFLQCRAPDCLAMICGNFKFAPATAVAVGGTDQNPSIDAPANTNAESSQIFYKAQCRFLKMDAS